MQDHEGITVGEAAHLLGVSVRTLHYWEQQGVAAASLRSPAGYRLYHQDDLTRLRRVQLYRQLNLPLAQIRQLLETQTQLPRDLLQAQRDAVATQIAALTQAKKELDTMISAHENGILLSEEEQRQAFGNDWDPTLTKEAQQRWGHTQQWAQYAEGSAPRTVADWANLTAASAELEAALASAVHNQVAPDSQEASQLVEQHRLHYSQYYPLSRSMQVCLGRMYQADPRFREHYEAQATGLTDWLSAAIAALARQEGIDPDTASWE